MNPEDQPWWPQLVEAAQTASLLQLSKQFDVDPVSLVQAMKRAGVERNVAPRSEPVRRVVRRLATPAEPPSRPKKPVVTKPLPEEQPWWPKFLKVAGARTLLQLSREFETDAIELVAALDRQGIDRSKLPKTAPPPKPRKRRVEVAEPAPTSRRRANKSPAPAAPDPLVQAIVTKLHRATEGIAASAIATDAAAEHLAVRDMLKELEQQGIVYRTGRARGTRWWLG